MLKGTFFDKPCSSSLLAAIFVAIVQLALLSGYGVSETANGHPIVLMESGYDIDHDGVKEAVQIVLEQGRRYWDKEPWCGKGEKWEGKFTIRTIKGSHVLTRQSLNELLQSPGEEEDLFFWTPSFHLVFNDYNSDGRIDFNLGQYGSCNGNLYRLFTINPNGTVERVPIVGGGGLFVSTGKRRNSTDAIRLVRGGIEFTSYDNSVGRNVASRFVWNGQAFERAAAKSR